MSAADDDLGVALRMIVRLESGERLSIRVGAGVGAGEIGLAPDYEAAIRDELLTALRQKAARLAQKAEAE